jgi:Secretion system C-terminal sorting domain
MKKTLFALCCLFMAVQAQAQNDDDCNQLGAWIWYIEITGFDTHGEIADTLKALGVKRVYLKVADGSPNPSVWPELTNTAVPQAYHDRGLEVWGWSYNYPSNPNNQSNALYTAAQTGYDGFVVDVEVEFDGLTTQVTNLFTAFANKKAQAIADGVADDDFKLYCTTWGNPADHNFAIDLIDPHVDGYMPQTYVEQWGPPYVNNLEYWIGVGNEEYTDLGATKPVHHMVALEEAGINATQINSFFETSGPEASIWRIPGGAIPMSYWETWGEIDWDMDFCSTSTRQPETALQVTCAPNPATDQLNITAAEGLQTLRVTDAAGRLVTRLDVATGNSAAQLPIGNWAQGLYFLQVISEQGRTHTLTFVKQ